MPTTFPWHRHALCLPLSLSTFTLQMKKIKGGDDGAAVLGVHLEGPFIHPSKKGAHPERLIRPLESGLASIETMYGEDLSQVAIVTLAPELEHAPAVIQDLTRKGIRVSLGHTHATLEQAEKGMLMGASCITHLFNAMTAFHHRHDRVIVCMCVFVCMSVCVHFCLCVHVCVHMCVLVCVLVLKPWHHANRDEDRRIHMHTRASSPRTLFFPLQNPRHHWLASLWWGGPAQLLLRADCRWTPHPRRIHAAGVCHAPKR